MKNSEPKDCYFTSLFAIGDALVIGAQLLHTICQYNVPTKILSSNQAETIPPQEEN
jgi:hypothetical protein